MQRRLGTNKVHIKYLGNILHSYVSYVCSTMYFQRICHIHLHSLYVSYLKYIPQLTSNVYCYLLWVFKATKISINLLDLRKIKVGSKLVIPVANTYPISDTTSTPTTTISLLCLKITNPLNNGHA